MSNVPPFRIASAPPSREELPVRVDRRAGAAVVTHYCFPVSDRTLERWPPTWINVNGKATTDTRTLLEVAEAKLKAAAPVRGGRSSAAA
jgi:hypothetical protein